MTGVAVDDLQLTIAKWTPIVESLGTSDAEKLLQIVRSIKNAVIGNKSKKQILVSLGVVPRLVQILTSSRSELTVQIQAAVVLGSLAHGSDQIMGELTSSGAVEALLTCLCHSNLKLVEASARSLEIILRFRDAPRRAIFRTDYMRQLIALLMNPVQNIQVAEAAASILANCCDTNDQQRFIADGGAIPCLINILNCNYPKAREAALDALASLSRENAALGQEIVSFNDGENEPALTVLLKLVKDSRSSTRLLAASCLTNLFKSGVISDRQADMALTVLPILVKLFVEPAPLKSRAPLMLAYLVSESEELQKAACDADAISKLAGMLTSTELTGSLADQLKENALTALAAVCSLKEECRKQVIDAKVLSHIVAAMGHSSAGVRSAACQCTRSLSRSVKNLRTSLVDAGIATPLFKLLSDESIPVQITASATLCNIVLDFSPMKKSVIEQGIVTRLVQLTHSTDHGLRLNAVWALKNLLYQAESDIKSSVMRQVTYSRLEALLNDSQIEVQEQAMNLLRNLACGKEADIEEVFTGFGEDKLMALIESRLKVGTQTELLNQTLFVIVNISIGNDRHKAAVMKRDSILRQVLQYMGHQQPAVRLATIWCLINLTWSEDPGATDRVRKLRSLGFESCLKAMTDDPDLDVRDRVKTALEHFSPPSSESGTMRV